MRITYDPEVDALSIRFRETTVTTRHLAEGLAADYDAEGHLAGIEILDVADRLAGEEKPGSKKRWDRQKALEAMKKLKGSGNGKLVEALLREREKDKPL